MFGWVPYCEELNTLGSSHYDKNGFEFRIVTRKGLVIKHRRRQREVYVRSCLLWRYG